MTAEALDRETQAMTAHVIQGFFIGGRPRVPMPVAQPKVFPSPPSLPGRALAAHPKSPMRPPGPPAPAFAGRPPVAQAHGLSNSFHVDPVQLSLTSGNGRPLPDAVRGKMEAALGANFSAVRVHVGPQAERIGAIAFTMGADIYFAPGRFQPDTVPGQQLLGHELTHVVQQRQGRVRNPLGVGIMVVQDRALEAEADRMGWRAAAPTTVQPKWFGALGDPRTRSTSAAVSTPSAIQRSPWLSRSSSMTSQAQQGMAQTFVGPPPLARIGTAAWYPQLRHRTVIQRQPMKLNGQMFDVPDKLGPLDLEKKEYYHFVRGGIPALEILRSVSVLNVWNVHIHVHKDGFDVTVARRGLGAGEQTCHFQYRNEGADFELRAQKGLLASEEGVGLLQHFCACSFISNLKTTERTSSASATLQRKVVDLKGTRDSLIAFLEAEKAKKEKAEKEEAEKKAPEETKKRARDSEPEAPQFKRNDERKEKKHKHKTDKDKKHKHKHKEKKVIQKEWVEKESNNNNL